MSDLCLLAALAASQAKQQAQALSEALVPPLTETSESRNDCRGEVDLAIASTAFSQDSARAMAVERQEPEFSTPQFHEPEAQTTAEQPAAHPDQDDAERVVPVAAEPLRYPAYPKLAQSVQHQPQNQEEPDDFVIESDQSLVRNSVRNSVQNSPQTIQNTTPPAPPAQRGDRPQSLLPSIADPSLSVPALPEVALSAPSSISPPDAIHPVPHLTRDASAVSAIHSSRSRDSALNLASHDSAIPNAARASLSLAADAHSPSSPTVLSSTQWSGEPTPAFEPAFESEVSSTEARSPLLARIAVPQTKAVRPASGSQFFRQRWAALQAGRSYTRLDPDSFAQQWLNATYQPSHEDWVSLLAQEANAMARGQGNNRLTILLGDSISLWFPADYMARYRFWLNQSISGDTAAGTIRRLSLFSRTRPDTIHVMLGINDLRRGVSDAQLLNDQRYIMRRLRQQHPQAQIVVHSILPTRLDYLRSDRIQPINRQLEAIAQQEGVQFLDLQPYFADAEGNLRTDLTTDGLHLNPQGYAMWYRVLSHFRLV